MGESKEITFLVVNTASGGVFLVPLKCGRGSYSGGLSGVGVTLPAHIHPGSLDSGARL